MDSKAGARINARIDHVAEEKVAYIQRRTKQSVSEIVVTSLDLYYRSLKNAPATASQALSGFIGCSSADPDLSESYKTDLAASLARKT